MTGGLLLFARDEASYEILLEAFEERTLDKIYTCQVKGCPEERDRTIRGKVRLLDFGSARSSDSLKDTLTITLRHGFAPIEQYQQGGGQGPWTDVYALCATLYFCLTGITPPVATNRIIEDSLIPPSGLGVEITPSRENALMRGLRVQPHRRCRTIRDLWSAFYK